MRGAVLVLVLAVAGCDEGGGGYPDAEDALEIADTVDWDAGEPDTPADVDDDERRCLTDEDCEDGNACTHNMCNLEDDRCWWQPYDEDGDGGGPEYIGDEYCGGTDCDDTRDDVFSGAPRGCDDIDHDCDDRPDNDEDGDSYVSEACGGNDCNDADPSIRPGAVEICDTLDQDCDDLVTDAPDGDDDGDLHLDESCGGDDCDDTRSDTHLGATEICGDSVDQDCNTIPDDATAPALIDVRVTNAAGPSTVPSLAWTGSGFGVVWMDERDGNSEVYFSRIDAVGSPVGSNLRITNAVTASRSPRIAWTGTGYGIAWFDHRDGNEEIYLARLGPDGVKIGSDARVTNDLARSRYPAIAWSGSHFGIAFTDNRDGNEEIYFARVDGSGAEVGAEVGLTLNAYTSFEPAVAWSGSEFGVCWKDERDGNGEVYFTRVTAAGTKVGGDRRITNAANSSAFPSLAWTGSEYGACWHDARDDTSPLVSPYVHEIYCARIATDGTKIGADVRMTSALNVAWYPSLVWMGAKFAVSWIDYRSGNGEIYLGLMTADGVKSGPDTRITNETHESWNPSLAWTGTELAVSWDDDRDGNQEIYVNRIVLCD